jgi:hypothetical protein
MRVRSLSFRDRTVGDAGGCRLADALLKVRHERRRSCGNLRSVAARWRSPPVINGDAARKVALFRDEARREGGLGCRRGRMASGSALDCERPSMNGRSLQP